MRGGTSNTESRLAGRSPNQVGAGVDLGSQEIVHLPSYVPPRTNGRHAQLSQNIHVDIQLLICNREGGTTPGHRRSAVETEQGKSREHGQSRPTRVSVIASTEPGMAAVPERGSDHSTEWCNEDTGGTACNRICRSGATDTPGGFNRRNPSSGRCTIPS
jgi:hypothetical protein